MLILAVKPGHDGAIAVVGDRRLQYMLEGEKDNFRRHEALAPMSFLDVMERIDAIPDVFAIGGWRKRGIGRPPIGAGYEGANAVAERVGRLFGKKTQIFSSSHVRSHIMMAAGMAPADDFDRCAVLVWEGVDGSFYLLDERWNVLEEIPVMEFPGVRYAMIYSIAHPDYGKVRGFRTTDAGKLMALAAYGDAASADAAISETVDMILAPDYNRQNYRNAPFHNAGVQAESTVTAAALITERMFDVFARAAREHLPAGIPLYISGGCGLNCDWNRKWRDLGHFSSVFVPPCANDSGSALGTALDALAAKTGDPRVDWGVYCGLEFDWDHEPDTTWRRRNLDYRQIADALADGRVVAWVQGRWEMGPRALGNRSLLAEPSSARTRDLLNEIKQREEYRPIAPCVRLEDVGRFFDVDFHDPYMLYFRLVTSPDLGAVTHVDGSARAQTVTREENKPLYDLLSAFAERNGGVGVLCNTSLNFKGFGFINRMSDLVRYCEDRGVGDFVVGDAWFQRMTD